MAICHFLQSGRFAISAALRNQIGMVIRATEVVSPFAAAAVPITSTLIIIKFVSGFHIRYAFLFSSYPTMILDSPLASSLSDKSALKYILSPIGIRCFIDGLFQEIHSRGDFALSEPHGVLFIR
jgi:hypothetical protein